TRSGLVRSGAASSGTFFAERKTKSVQERTTFVVGPTGGNDRHVHPPGRVDLVVVDLGEYQLLVDPEGVIASTIETLGREPSEVTDTRDRKGDKPVEELPHPVASQRHLGPDGVALTELERRDRLSGLCDNGFLPGYQGQVPHCTLQEGGLSHGLADAHVDH